MCIIKEITINLPSDNTGLSSVGLERCLDRAEVTGSNPVVSTKMGVSVGVRVSVVE